MGDTVVAGRAITWEDVRRPTTVALISENLAREYWGEPSRALGKRIGGPVATDQWMSWTEVVGVVGNEYLDGLNHPPPTTVYFALNAKWITRNMSFVVRSPRVGQPGFLRELQQAVRQVLPNLPLANPQTLEAIQAKSMARTSFAIRLGGVVGHRHSPRLGTGVSGRICRDCQATEGGSQALRIRTEMRGVPDRLASGYHDELRRFVPHAQYLRDVLRQRAAAPDIDDVHASARLRMQEVLDFVIDLRAGAAGRAVFEDDDRLLLGFAQKLLELGDGVQR